MRVIVRCVLDSKPYAILPEMLRMEGRGMELCPTG